MDSLLLLSQSPEPQNHPISDPANPIADDETTTTTTMMKIKTKMKKKSNLEKRKGKMITNNNNNEASSSSSCCSSSSTKRVSRVTATHHHHRLRNPCVRLGMMTTRRSVGERQAEALALPLGMSFAAFANLVLERKSVAGQNVYVDDLAVVSASAVTESLSNVYGNKLGSFATNFEKSFNSTLRILRLINESACPQQLENNSNLDGYSDNEQSAKDTSSTTTTYEAIQGNATTNPSLIRELVLHEGSRQLSGVFPRRSSSMPLTTFERSVQEQARANDLKEMEMGLKMKKIWQKETELALSDESNNLKKTKIDMGVTKAAFKEEKFKTEQEDKKKADMVTSIMDWLLVNVFIMLISMSYSVYTFSHERIKEATSICQPSEEKSSSWWIMKQVSSWNTGFNIWICHLKVWVQMLFGVLMILVFTYFIIQRSSGSKQTMPVTFIVLFLGIVCGLAGKLCVDTLGGNGKLWLLLWEMFCVLQFVANVFTLALFRLIYGPISVSPQGVTKSRVMVPFWVRKSFFFGMVLFVLPVVNGLLPFASFGEWRDHFGLILYEFLRGGSLGSDEL